MKQQQVDETGWQLQSAKKVGLSVRTSNFECNNKWMRLAGSCSCMLWHSAVYCLRDGQADMKEPETLWKWK